MTRDEILAELNRILEKQGVAPATDLSSELSAIGFKSLDFSELALRVETALDEELNFDADKLRQIRTVNDVLDFFESVHAG